jgi:hypothetical protein
VDVDVEIAVEQRSRRLILGIIVDVDVERREKK